MCAKLKKQKVKRFKAGPELARVVQELKKKYPENDLYELLNDVFKLPQAEQHNIFFAADATQFYYKKIKRFKAGADLASTHAGK